MGILITYIIGAFVDWYVLAFIVGGFNLVMFFGMILMPESPIWLLANSQDDEAKRSLQRLRGRSVTSMHQNTRNVPVITIYDSLFQSHKYWGGIPANERQSTEKLSTKLRDPTIRISQRFRLETSRRVHGSYVLPAIHRNQCHGLLHHWYFYISWKHYRLQICHCHHWCRSISLHCRLRISGYYMIIILALLYHIRF